MKGLPIIVKRDKGGIISSFASGVRAMVNCMKREVPLVTPRFDQASLPIDLRSSFDPEHNHWVTLVDKEWFKQYKIIWDESVLNSLLTEQKKKTYLFGYSENTFNLLDQFDKAYYLYASRDLIKRRFAEERTNPWGSTKEQQKMILDFLPILTVKARIHGLTFIPADRSPEEVHRMTCL